jgi:hypothetical protein
MPEKKKRKRSLRPEDFHTEISNDVLRKMFLRSEEFDRLCAKMGEEAALEKLPELDKKYGLS